MPTSSILDFKRFGTIGRLCVAIGFAAISTASWSTGCDTFVSSNSAPCVTGESGKGVARSTFSNPNLNVAVAIGPNLGASSARPAFGGLAVTTSGIAAQTGAAAASGPSRWNAWLAGNGPSPRSPSAQRSASGRWTSCAVRRMLRAWPAAKADAAGPAHGFIEAPF